MDSIGNMSVTCTVINSVGSGYEPVRLAEFGTAADRLPSSGSSNQSYISVQGLGPINSVAVILAICRSSSSRVICGAVPDNDPQTDRVSLKEQNMLNTHHYCAPCFPN